MTKTKIYPDYSYQLTVKKMFQPFCLVLTQIIATASQVIPSLTFERRWKTKLDDGSGCPDGGHGESCGYGTVSMTVSKDIIYVLNGAAG